MRNSQAVIEGEHVVVGSKPLMNLGGLDLHLSRLAEPDCTKTTPSSLVSDPSSQNVDGSSSSSSKGTPATESEIVVRADDMETDPDGKAPNPL